MIYFCHNYDNHLTKIGCTKHPRARWKTIRSYVPSAEFISIISGDRDREKELHRRFAEQRVEGEWFSLRGDQIDAVTEEFEEKEEY